MSDRVRITLKPLDASVDVPAGTPLKDLLFPFGVEFPCGGIGECEGCRVKVLEGVLPVTEKQRLMLSGEDLAQGWRLACCCDAMDDLTLELAQWKASILTDYSTFPFTPADGCGIAIDCGTTTLALQLLDRRTGNILNTVTALNEQARYGADIMSRVNLSLAEGTRRMLVQLLRRQLGELIDRLLLGASIDRADVRAVTIVGNTVMHHFVTDTDLEPLSHYPFQPSVLDEISLKSEECGWNLPASAEIKMLPCLGGFVGSDILAGILATGLYNCGQPAMLVDLGTNGEIVIGNRDRLLCCSTAAGPAFEGANISRGMRAASGAIDAVRRTDGGFTLSVIGNTEPKGICGSGLVDAISVGLDLDIIEPSGKLRQKDPWLLQSPVSITQKDIREMQLAKAAIAAGMEILSQDTGIGLNGIGEIYLAGAFGNYIGTHSALRIGLLPAISAKISPKGNTALLGAKIALFPYAAAAITTIRSLTSHISLNTHQRFQDIFVEQMSFPKRTAE